MYSQTKIAIPIFQKRCKDVIEVANDCISKGADVLEFRIDALKNPDPTESAQKAVRSREAKRKDSTFYTNAAIWSITLTLSFKAATNTLKGFMTPE